jgi:molybdopterin molybdotransferase
MLNVEEALELVEKNAEPFSARRVAIGDAAGLMLAEEIRSDVDSPPYDKALMDGYAVRCVDREPERQVLEEIAAGSVPRYPLTPGSASRIMTGAPIPEGADAVVQIERTQLVGESTVRLEQLDPPAGQNILPIGAAMRAGDVVLRSGTMLRPIEIGILAEIGRGMVTAIPRARVAILATGNELVAVGEKPAQGQIRNSNGPLLLAAAERAGAVALQLGIARDERDELRQWIEQGLAADVLVLSGGVSAGKFDLVPGVLAELGVEQVFHKVALKPGKPLWFGVKSDGERRVLVFGLPGNPVSSFVCFELFVRPAICEMAGRGFTGLPKLAARLSHSFDHAGGRATYLPGVLSGAGSVPAPGVATQWDPSAVSNEPPGGRKVTILPWQGSADLATLGRANALVSLSGERQQIAAGTVVDVVLI